MFQATIFQTLPLQQVETQVSSVSSQQNSQAVTDVIQQLLELSEPGPVEAQQSPQSGRQLSVTVGINQDILQVKHAYLLGKAFTIGFSEIRVYYWAVKMQGGWFKNLATLKIMAVKQNMPVSSPTGNAEF